jgi:methionyl-tRNA synthetase
MKSWSPDSDVELHHFIGKDIANFHCLFCQRCSKVFPEPTGVFSSRLSDGRRGKMSKSRGNRSRFL